MTGEQVERVYGDAYGMERDSDDPYLTLRRAEILAHRPRDPRRQWWVGHDSLVPATSTRRARLLFRWRLWRWNRSHPKLAQTRRELRSP